MLGAGLLCQCDDPAPSDSATPDETSLLAPAPPAPEERSRAPLVVEPEEVQLGVVAADQSLLSSFEVRNPGPGSARVLNIQGSCDCLGFDYDRRELAAGEALTVSATLRPRKGKGEHHVHATIESNVVGARESEVHFRYFLLPTMEFRPSPLSLGRRMRGTTATDRIVAKLELPENFAVPTVTARVPADAPFQLTFEPPQVVREGHLQKVEVGARVSLDTSRLLAPFRSRVAFESAGFATKDLLVTGQVHPGWYLEASRVKWGAVPVGESRTRKVLLFYTRDQAPEILELSCPHPAISLAWAAQSGARALRLDVTFTPQEPGPVETVAQVRTTLSEDVQTLELVAQGK